jgi:multidrug transporter EmrE-like cation transporter
MRTYLLLAATLAFSVYPQIVLKWRVVQLPAMPVDRVARFSWGLAFVCNPWMLSCFASGFFAFVTWSAVLRKMPLSQAYPFLGLSFLLVAWLSSILFDEALSTTRLLGTVLVVVGLVLASRG